MEIESIKKRISHGLNENEFRGILEENHVSRCFFCTVYDLEKNLKEAWIRNMQVLACPYCYEKRVLPKSKIIDETSDSTIEILS